MALSYWVKVLDFIPYFKSETSDKSTGNKVYYVDKKLIKYILCLI